MAHARVVNVELNQSETCNLADYPVKLLAEGDSWFAWSQLNLNPSSNVLRELEFQRASIVINYAYSGDTIRHMASICASKNFYFDVVGDRYDAILLSGGGNDLIDALYDYGADQPLILKPAMDADAAVAESYIDSQKLDALKAYLQANFRQMFGYRAERNAPNRDTPVLLHTYDFPTPRNAPARFMGRPAVGPWVWRALEAIGAPPQPQVRQDICDAVFNALADALLELDDPANHVHVVDTRNTLMRAAPGTQELSGDWINEIHPDGYGYALVARKLTNKLVELGIA